MRATGSREPAPRACFHQACRSCRTGPENNTRQLVFLVLLHAASYLVSEIQEDRTALEDGQILVAMINETWNAAVGVDIGSVVCILDRALALTESKGNGVVLETKVLQGNGSLDSVGSRTYASRER